jgi:protein SCO1
MIRQDLGESRIVGGRTSTFFILHFSFNTNGKCEMKNEKSTAQVMTAWVTLLFVSVFAARPVQAQPGLPPSLRNVGFDQKLDAQIPLDLTFADETGHAVRLGDYFGSKPVILVLAYFRCPMLCTEVLNGLVRAMLDLPFDAGKDFNVVTVSFDARETPQMAAAKKKTYLERYGRHGAQQGWHFLTGDQKAIRRLTDAVGFHFTYDEQNDQFAHASGIMVLTPSARISRYFYDIHYSPRDLRLGLVEASQNRIGSPIDQVLLYCFHYDPIEGKYGPIVMSFVRLGGVLTMLAIGTFVAVMWRMERRINRTSSFELRPSDQGHEA